VPLVSSLSDDLAPVVAIVEARPGLSRAAAARLLGCRRTTGLELLARAVAAGLVHEDESYVTIRGGAVRTAPGLFPGAGAELLFVEPGLSGEYLRSTRLRAKVNAASLAAHLGVTRVQLYRWESGQQPVPPRVRGLLRAAIEAAQTAQDAPAPRGHAAGPAYELLQAVRDQPGRSRWALSGRSQRTRRLLEQLLASGQVHEAPAWTEHTRQPSIGVFPGPSPRRETRSVLLADLRAARLAAGWSHLAMAGHIGVAGTTVARWERECEAVPGWATDAAAPALIAAQAARRDERAAVLAVITAEPGLSRKTLLARLGYSRSPLTQGRVDALITAGLVHEEHADQRGRCSGLYPGPAAAEVLSPDDLRTGRTRAGLTQAELAERVGTHVQAVRDWEGGHRVLSPDWQRRLLEHLTTLPDAGTALLLAVADAVREQPRTRHELERLELGARGQVSAALDALVASGEIHVGRIGAGIVNARGQVSRGRVGYLNGPGPVGA
jgi:transcriptional regulator with XRE-family HTH domain